MKERPILFSAPMVQAILAGTKTQTRRVVGGKNAVHQNITPTDYDDESGLFEFERCTPILGCRKYWIHSPYGKVGDQIWVRESWRKIDIDGCGCERFCGCIDWPFDYRATAGVNDKKWKPSIHMPRLASRIQLEITNIRVERLHDISEEDAQFEGAPLVLGFDNGKEKHGWQTYIEWYQWLWKQINGTESWQENPWVWVIEFKKV